MNTPLKGRDMFQILWTKIQPDLLSINLEARPAVRSVAAQSETCLRPDGVPPPTVPSEIIPLISKEFISVFFWIGTGLPTGNTKYQYFETLMLNQVKHPSEIVRNDFKSSCIYALLLYCNLIENERPFKIVKRFGSTNHLESPTASISSCL